MPTENHSTSRERPILFSGPMVRAILDGRKTVTRRVAKPVKHPDLGNMYAPGALVLEKEPQHVIDRACPYGQHGDRLWVRETFAHGHQDAGADCGMLYRATDHGWDDNNSGLRWRPSIHMPRWASRILLEITAVRVERLQDITNEQAIAEGIGEPLDERYAVQDEFRPLWESINGAGSWDDNPWVWVVEFKRVTP